MCACVYIYIYIYIYIYVSYTHTYTVYICVYIFLNIFVQSAELKKQKVSEIKEGIEEAEALVSSSLMYSFGWKSFLYFLSIMAF